MDMIRLRILYTSPQILDIIGIKPEDFDLSYDLNNTHPSDIRRRSRIRARLVETSQDFFINKSGEMIFSTSFKMKQVDGGYSHRLVQSYLFYSSAPEGAVFSLFVSTPVEMPPKTAKRGNYHWYAGNDMSYFRYPDEELLNIGTNLSEREHEIIMCIHEGMGSKEIGDKLCLSTHTINTHRRNILKKSGKSTFGELIYELEEIGMI